MRLMKRSLPLLLLPLRRDAELRPRKSRTRLMKRSLLLFLLLPLPREGERPPPRTLRRRRRRLPPRLPLRGARLLLERQRMKLKRSLPQSEDHAGPPPRRPLLSRRMKTLLKNRRKTRSLLLRPRAVVDALARFERVLVEMSRCLGQC
jgi:hypothetical protein